MPNSVFIVICFIAIVLIILFLLRLATIIDTPGTTTTVNTGSVPGNVCATNSDCGVGLYCLNSICVIPTNGNCANYETYCKTGTTCVDSKCTSTSSSD